MGIIVAGEFTFYECNVAFHFQRDNAYSPWNVIGIYLTSPKFQGSRYVRGRKDFECRFTSEVDLIDSPYIAGEIEFLELWRKKIYSPHDVIGPIVNYCTTYGRTSAEFRDVMIHLFTKYVGACSPVVYQTLALMLRMKNHYFPAIFIDGARKDKITKALQEAGLL